MAGSRTETTTRPTLEPSNLCPTTQRREYNQAPGKLEDEWVYRHHPEDWQNYHTRYVTSEPIDQALRSGAAQ